MPSPSGRVLRQAHHPFPTIDQPLELQESVGTEGGTARLGYLLHEREDGSLEMRDRAPSDDPLCVCGAPSNITYADGRSLCWGCHLACEPQPLVEAYPWRPARPLVTALLALVLLGCGGSWEPISIDVCDEPNAQAFALDCLRSTNTSGILDEEPEDWIAECYRQARLLTCKQETGIAWFEPGSHLPSGERFRCSEEGLPAPIRTLCVARAQWVAR